MTVARGRISERSAATASSASSRAPDSATITGSWTTGVPVGSASSSAATISIVATSPSMPIFTASTPRSSATARTCPAMIWGSTGCTARTLTVFCTVIAVIAVVPWTPANANALRSAWMPAPPPESDPAIERATGTRRRGTDARIRRATPAPATRAELDGRFHDRLEASGIAPSRPAAQEPEQLELGQPGKRRLRLRRRRRELADRVAAVLHAAQQRAQRPTQLVGAPARQRGRDADAEDLVEGILCATDDQRAVAQQRVGTGRARGRDRRPAPRRPRGPDPGRAPP